MSGHTYIHTHIHTYTHVHTYTHDNYSNPRCAHAHRGLINYIRITVAHIIRIIYTVLMQNRSCFTRKQTCNGEYTKHCTWSRHQLKMAAPAEVSERRSNFRIRQF